MTLACECASADEWCRRVETAYRMHRAHIASVLAKYAQPAIIEDALQEVFVRILRGGPSRKVPVEVQLSERYLVVCVRRMLWRDLAHAVRVKKTVKRAVECESPLTLDRTQAHSDPAHKPVIDADREAVDSAMSRLPDCYRNALRMLIAECTPNGTAARALCCSETTLPVWKHRGIAQMRRLLAKPAAKLAS